MILRLAGPGDVLGLSATLGNLPHEVTAETLEPTHLKSVRKGEFLDFLEKYAEVGQNAAKTLAKEYHDVFLDARRLALSGSAAGRSISANIPGPPRSGRCVSAPARSLPISQSATLH